MTMRIMMIAATVAPYPRGKGEVCKTFMHRFDSGRRLEIGPLQKRAEGFGIHGVAPVSEACN